MGLWAGPIIFAIKCLEPVHYCPLSEKLHCEQTIGGGNLPQGSWEVVKQTPGWHNRGLTLTSAVWPPLCVSDVRLYGVT